METKDCQKSLSLTTLRRSRAPQCYHSFQQDYTGLLSVFKNHLKQLNQQRGSPGWCKLESVSSSPDYLHRAGLGGKLKIKLKQ